MVFVEASILPPALNAASRIASRIRSARSLLAGETFICENVLVVAIEQAAAVVGPPLEGSRSALDGGVRVGYGAFADRCLDEWNVIGFEERSDATFALGRFASFADLTHVSDRPLVLVGSLTIGGV